MINFEITMILGCWSSVHVIMVSIVILVLVPILIYQAWRHHRENTQHARVTKELLKNIVKVPFEKQRFSTVNECIICFDDFQEG